MRLKIFDKKLFKYFCVHFFTNFLQFNLFEHLNIHENNYFSYAEADLMKISRGEKWKIFNEIL